MTRVDRNATMADNSVTTEEFVHLTRLSLAGRGEDVTMYVQRLVRRLRSKYPDLAAELMEILREAPTRSSPLRKATPSPTPVDLDSRLALIRVERPEPGGDVPILAPQIDRELRQIIAEHHRADRLMSSGLLPTRTALFVGPPGVGKTLAAHWLAAELGLPLLVLDLAAVMSSLLGRTGTNLRHVIDYAKTQRCVLLLDEFDSIAKRRDDDSDIGELKRLVTVLLQQVDDWPGSSGVLIAATNHPELLDPAVWRRFDSMIEFPLPNLSARRTAIERFSAAKLPSALVEALALATEGRSFSDLERELARARRAAALAGEGQSIDVLMDLLEDQVTLLPLSDRRAVASNLVRSGATSQRKAYDMTGVSRDTIRKDLRDGMA